MSNQTHNSAAVSKTQKAIAILGGIVAPVLIVCTLIHSGAVVPVMEESAAKIEERIKPVAMVEVGESGPHVEKSGEEVTKASCAACHATGAMNAPKIGDKSAWGPRIAQGNKILVKHAIDGLKMMPARGGNPDLTDSEIAGAVVYMANESGAKFAAPKPAASPATP